MSQNLKEEFVQSFFKLKKMCMGFRLETDIRENECDINMAELVLMKGVADNAADSENNTSLSEIRDYLSLSKAAISQMLAVLEKKGYINRDIDKNNRRNLIVTLTPKGREVITRNENDFDDMLTKIIAILGEDDLRQMVTLTNRLIEAVDQIKSETNGG